MLEMYKEDSLQLTDELHLAIKRAVAASAKEGHYRVAPERFNNRPANAERNEFTGKFFKELSWLNSREGRARSSSVGSWPQSILSDVIDVTLHYAVEQGFSPLQVLRQGLQHTSSVLGSPAEMRLVVKFLSSILAEAEEQLHSKMFKVAYLIDSKPKLQKQIDRWLGSIQGEYRRGGYGLRDPLVWIHFELEHEANGFKVFLAELGIEVVPSPEQTGN